MKSLCRLLVTAFLFATLARAEPAASPDPYADESPAQRDARMAWWREARFGMFIHWGVSAVPAGSYQGRRIDGYGEWIMHDARIPVREYRSYARAFNPVKYDPDAWVRLAREAGMKYIVITAKHHDGFALFDSAVTDWDVVDATPYQKDLLAPLADACRKYGVRLGFYYSQIQDWVHTGGAGNDWDPSQTGSMDEYIDRIAVPQVKELLTRYGAGTPAILWWDTGHNNPEWAARLIATLKDSPGIIHNDRLGGGYRGDTETPEQSIPATGFRKRDWETCMTLNETWGFKTDDHNWKSATALLRNLCDIASKGGNYLLNIGPTAEGEIPAESIALLKEIGAWMALNGESIHGSTASPFGRVPFGCVTHRARANGGTLYLHVFDWPANGELTLYGLRNPVSNGRMLAGGAPIAATVVDDSVVLSLPAATPDPRVAVLALDYTGALEIVQEIPKADTRGVVRLLAHHAAIHNHPGSDAKLEGDNIGFWTSANVTADWTFECPSDGDFELQVEYACLQSQNITLAVGGRKMDVHLPATGDYQRYATIPAGRVAIRAGEQTLSIIPVAQAWQAVNVKGITLSPAH